MSNAYHQYNIFLEEAVTMSLSQSIRIWSLKGIHVQDDEIPENSDFKLTVVVKFPDGRLQVKVHWIDEQDHNSYVGTVAEFSKLEELKNKYPNLFELEGSLLALE